MSGLCEAPAAVLAGQERLLRGPTTAGLARRSAPCQERQALLTGMLVVPYCGGRRRYTEKYVLYDTLEVCSYRTTISHT